MATLERSVNRCTTIDRELSLIVCPAKKKGESGSDAGFTRSAIREHQRDFNLLHI